MSGEIDHEQNIAFMDSVIKTRNEMDQKMDQENRDYELAARLQRNEQLTLPNIQKILEQEAADSEIAHELGEREVYNHNEKYPPIKKGGKKTRKSRRGRRRQMRRRSGRRCTRRRI